MAAPLLMPRTAGKLIVGIGEFAVTDQPGGSIVTHALGSCIAVCIWDPTVRVAGLLHFLHAFQAVDALARGGQRLGRHVGGQQLHARDAGLEE